MLFNYKDVIKKINKKNIYVRSLMMIFGVFCLSLTYNSLLLENDLIVGGSTGVGIIFEYLCGINSVISLLVFNILTLLLGFIFLNKDTIKKSIVGSLMFPLLVELTIPLSKLIIPYLKFDSDILVILVSGLALGASHGIILKNGFNTGGGDILTLLINKYCKISIGKSSFIVNGIIIILGGLFFGIPQMLYSIITITISTNLIDHILIGISDSKIFFIYTRKQKEVESYIMDELHTGVTILKAEGGFSQNRKKMLMCVVPNRDYFLFKESILIIDPNAFFVINDCYEVSGGMKRANLPFI